MADDKKKLDFKKFSATKKRKPTTDKPIERKVYQEVTEAPKEAIKTKTKSEPKKVGRKSWKEAEVRYTRIAFDTPVGTKQKIKQLLAGKFYDKYISQDEMINVALNEFIKKHL